MRYTGWAKKRGHRLITIILSNLNRFTKLFFTEKFLGEFSVKCILNIPPHLACVATLPCDTLMSAKQAINDRLSGRVATYLRCGGLINDQIKKSLLLSLPNIHRLKNFTHKVTSKNASCTLCAWPTHCWKTEKVHETGKQSRSCW